MTFCLEGSLPPKQAAERVAQGVSTLKKMKREAAAQRRPARSERKNRAFSAKRQAVWFETHAVSN